MSLENEVVADEAETPVEPVVQPLAAEKLKNVLEGALFAAGKPMTLRQLTELFAPEETPPQDSIKQAVEQLQQDYQGRGVELQEVASGFRFQVVAELAPWVGRMWEEKPARYSRALLETLALVAYRQPITRGEIEDIRGVSVSTHITKTLLERDWIRVVGHRDVPGRPAMYGTTRTFLDYFNLSNLDQLPSLAEIRDLDTIGAELDLMTATVAVAGPEAAVEPEAVAEPETAEQEFEADQSPETVAQQDEVSQELAEKSESSEVSV